MTPAQKAKSMGLKSLSQVRDLHGKNKNGHPLVSLATLKNWHINKPELFHTVLIGSAVRLGVYVPDRCAWWEATNTVTGCADHHGNTKREVMSLIDEYGPADK